MKNVNLPDDLESPNDRFFTHAVVDWFLTNAGNNEVYDWKKLGSKEEDKCENLSLKLLDTTNMIVSKGGMGFFWIICNPFISDLLSLSKGMVSASIEQFPLGCNTVLFMGILRKRWRIYTDMLMAKNNILIGAGFSQKHANYYCNIKIDKM